MNMNNHINEFSNPNQGRILNRFSRDIGIIDDYIPVTAFELKLSITDVLGILIIEIIIDWYFVFPAIVFLLLMYFFSSIYIRTARELKRLEGIGKVFCFAYYFLILISFKSISSKKSNLLTHQHHI